MILFTIPSVKSFNLFSFKSIRALHKGQNKWGSVLHDNGTFGEMGLSMRDGGVRALLNLRFKARVMTDCEGIKRT